MLLPAQALLATVVLALLIAFPSLARIGALAAVGGLAVAVPLVLVAVAVGLSPAPPIVAGGAVMVAAGYLAAGALAAAYTLRERARSGS